MMIQWKFYCRHHRQFHKTIFDASLTINFPVSVWMICVFFALMGLIFYKANNYQKQEPAKQEQQQQQQQQQHAETTEETSETLEEFSPSPSQLEEPTVVEIEKGDCDALTLAVDDTHTHTDHDTERDIAEDEVLTKSSSKETVIAQEKGLGQDRTTGDSPGASAVSIPDDGKEGEGKETMQSQVAHDDSLDLDTEDEWIVLDS